LREPRRRDGVYAAGGDQPVVRGGGRPAERAVAGDQAWGVAEAGEAGPGGRRELVGDVDAGEAGAVGVAEPVAEQGGVVAGAGADLQHGRGVADVEGVEHGRHEGGL
jgi:hypothetical protein